MSRQHLLCIVVAAALASACAPDRAAERETELAAEPAADDRQAAERLEGLSGCFSVRYQFVEDGTERDFFSPSTIEYMDVRKRGDGYLVRNFLILDEETSFLHWTQDWSRLGRGVWQMKVATGTGSPRYDMRGTWQFNQWKGESALAVKPIRDGERTDYDMLRRRNTIQFTDKGWIQSEVNVKVQHDGTAVANEVGWIVYTKQPTNDACSQAIDATMHDRPTLDVSAKLVLASVSVVKSPSSL